MDSALCAIGDGRRAETITLGMGNKALGQYSNSRGRRQQCPRVVVTAYRIGCLGRILGLSFRRGVIDVVS